MLMVPLALLLAAAQATAQPHAARPLPPASARSQVMVRIVRAAAVRDGLSDEPHQRRVRQDAEGRSQLLLEFE